MGVNARTPCRGDWRGESCPTVPGAGREHSDQAALPTLVLIDPCLDQPCQVPCSRIGSLADALAGGTSACDLPGVPTPVSLNEDTEDVIVVSSHTVSGITGVMESVPQCLAQAEKEVP